MPKTSVLWMLFAVLCGTFIDAQKLNRSSRHAPEQSQECRESLSNCTDMVTPYLMNQNYMFPQNMEHVNDMCRMWSRFVDCTRRYISNCFEEKRRALFHKSVESSIDTVHAICSSKTYQTEYLGKAQCFKRVSVEHCAQNYQDLIATVANPHSHDDHICCHYAHFRKCVNTPLLTECGRKSKNLMDHSMSFLISRCQLYNKAQSDCPKPEVYKQPRQMNPQPDKDDEKLLTATTTDAVSSEAPKIGISKDATSPNSKVMVGRAFSDDSSEEQYKPETVPISEVENVDNQLNNNDASESILDKKVEIDAQGGYSSTEESMIVYTIKPQFQVGAFHITSSSASSLIASLFTLVFVGFTFL